MRRKQAIISVISIISYNSKGFFFSLQRFSWSLISYIFIFEKITKSNKKTG